MMIIQIQACMFNIFTCKFSPSENQLVTMAKLQEYLNSINVIVNFSNCKRKSDSTIIHKAKKKCCNGISDINIIKLKDLLANKLENGECTIDNLVVPKTYQKLI